MPLGQLAIAGIGTGLSALNKIIGGKKISPGMEDPEKYRDQIVISDADLAGTRLKAGRQATRAGATALNRLRGTVAAGGLPTGAAAGHIKGFQRATAEGVSNIEGDLQAQKHQSEVDFYNQKQRFAAAKEEANRAAQPLDLTPEIGLLTKSALLMSSGLDSEMMDPSGPPGPQGVSGSGTAGVGARSSFGGGAIQPASMGVGGRALINAGGHASAKVQY